VIWVAAAHAGPESAGIELVEPAMSDGGFGSESGDILVEGSARVTALVQYVDEPLVSFADGEKVTEVVSKRASSQLAVAFGLTNRLSLRAGLPFVAQWGSNDQGLSADGMGLGDLVLGGRLVVFEGEGGGGAAFFVDQRVPVGRNEAWIGDAKGWRTYGFATSRRQGPLRVGGMVVAAARPQVETDDQLEFGFELRNGLAVGYGVAPDVEVTAEVLGRLSSATLSQGGSPTEALAGARWIVSEDWTLDVGVGAGVTRGYGTSKVRALFAATWTPGREPEDLEPILVEVPLPTPPEPYSAEDERASVDEVLIRHEWIEGELARIEGDQIVIRDPILFELGTERILPESLPVLDAVASVMASNDRIAHVVIEGHASPEGEFADNYDLSVRRARSVFERLLLVGVAADRLSYRGMGEVVPTAEGPIEDQRRVEFHIVSQLGPLDIAKPPRPDPKLPWSGEPVPPMEPR
jgi:outer membrane protein OmpA-like peptidoglycan-associated protein